MYTVYIIKSKEGFKYTGVTEDLERRLDEHNGKKLSFWTKRGSEWKLIYKEEFSEKSEAYKRERWFKTGNGRNYIKKILSVSEVQSA
jgi:putative endonuclease